MESDGLPVSQHLWLRWRIAQVVAPVERFRLVIINICYSTVTAPICVYIITYEILLSFPAVCPCNMDNNLCSAEVGSSSILVESIRVPKQSSPHPTLFRWPARGIQCPAKNITHRLIKVALPLNVDIDNKSTVLQRSHSLEGACCQNGHDSGELSC